MNRWIQRQWARERGWVMWKKLVRPLLRAFCTPPSSRVVEKVGFMHNWLTNYSADSLESLRRHCSISGSASPFIFLFPAPFTFVHLHNLPLGFVLPSRIVLSLQLPGPASKILFMGTVERMFIHCSIFVCLLPIDTLINLILSITNSILTVCNAVGLFQYTIMLSYPWQILVRHLMKYAYWLFCRDLDEKTDITLMPAH